MNLENECLWFGVWAVTSLGECACPQGTMVQEVRDGRIAWPGPCQSVGKHPWPMFPHGLQSAVPREEWLEIEPKVLAGGGRAAVALPDTLWVLDVDSDKGWRNLLALVKAGSIPGNQVEAAAKTRRGWHVWYRPGGEWRWTGGTAQSDVNRVLRSLGREVGGLDVKSAGGYVIWPDGRERRWVDLRILAREVGFGLGRRASQQAVVLGASKPVPSYAGGTSAAAKALEAMAEYVTEDQLGRWQERELAAMRQRMTQVPEGTRNNALNRTAFIEGRGCLRVGIPASVVIAELTAWGTGLGLTQNEVRATVRSGLGLV